MLRDGLPLSSPTRWSSGLKSFEPGEVATWRLFGGSINNGEMVVATVYHAGMLTDNWVMVQALIAIDGIAWPSPRPAQVFLNVDYPDGADRWSAWDGWSAVVNFPIMSHLPTLRGTHSLLLRTVRLPRIER